ncbi:MAG: 3-deoxy-7-phosphoheptulonate synthase [Anaerolineae bacterium]|jgi:3-deoxy-7-phosphoheptulonate synthase|nr:3-deoxy-7-phosphoheptulonate synthase [Chloroflexota bacterium]
MIVIMRSRTPQEHIQAVVDKVNQLGLKPHISAGEETTIIGVIGDERRLDVSVFDMMEGVERVVRVLKPFKLSSRDFHPENTVIQVNGTKIGADSVVIIGGPCSVESHEQLFEAARVVKESGGTLFRGGAYKPRTSPYSFRGLGEKALTWLAEVKAIYGLAIVTEVMSPDQIPMVSGVADIIQIGTRNMQNYALLDAAGRSERPVLLKRGMMSTIEELLMSAEYIMSNGNEQVILCERGIRTFETTTRNTLDISAVPVLKELTHLPVLMDPSHASGRARYVNALSRASIAAGADGLLIEMHPHPEQALSDGAQSISPEAYTTLIGDVRQVAAAVGRTL